MICSVGWISIGHNRRLEFSVVYVFEMYGPFDARVSYPVQQAVLSTNRLNWYFELND